MLKYICRRLYRSLPVIIGVCTLVFLLIHFVPGDPVDLMIGENGADADRTKLREALGLHLPLWQQYLFFWRHILDGTWGESFLYHRPVLKLVLQAFPATLLLSTTSLIFSLCFSLPLGVWAAYRQRSLWDKGLTAFSLLGNSIPVFVLAPLGILFFSIRLRVLPVAGNETWAHLILPTLCLGSGLSALLVRMVRNAVLENLQEDFVRTARAKGLSEWRVLFLHTLRNSLIPVITLVGGILGSLLAGSVITEQLFDWPGLGLLFLRGFDSRDLPLVQGIVLWIALSYVFMSLAIDILIAKADPRVRLEEDSV